MMGHGSDEERDYTHQNQEVAIVVMVIGMVQFRLDWFAFMILLLRTCTTGRRSEVSK
jgi:hypothetical protein